MIKQEEVKVTVPLRDLQELLRLVNMIEYPEVTYNSDKLVMAEHAIRRTKLYAEQMEDIITRWSK